MKVGIFSGTFDPVHAGHIAFALETVRQAGLDSVYFLPEQQPRRKQGVTHYAHRLAMLRLALRPYRKLRILELPDRQFTVRSSWPRLKNRFESNEIHMLVGSDMLRMLHGAGAKEQWPGYEKFLEEVPLHVGVRDELDADEAREMLNSLQPSGQIIETDRPHVSSSLIRRALYQGDGHRELLGSLKPYIKKHWLYASIDGVAANSSL